MAVDKLIDSTQLDADLTSVANAIRTKGGTSAQMAFPAGFVSAVNAIPTGDGFSIDDFLTKDGISGDITIGINHTPYVSLEGRTAITSVTILNNVVMGALFRNCTGLKSIVAENITSFYGNNAVFYGCSALETVRLPKATHIGQYLFSNCVSLSVIALPAASIIYDGAFSGCTSLATVDLGIDANINRANVFLSCRSLKTLILRKANGITPLGAISPFDNTPFASGGEGGTVYIPKAMYDHLGDGTNMDYKAATNWSTFDGYGTITWAAIEGSQYENDYADGTPIA